MQTIGVWKTIPVVRRACVLDFAFLIWLSTTGLAG
jgi:hypothetical protein